MVRVMGILLWYIHCCVLVCCTGWFANPAGKKTFVNPHEDMKVAFMAEMKAENIKQFL